ncbi:hypothetical protein T4E_474 [Trichinella pseudospiralis]|uniref:Secreted protein n=1 Tax=Trichinella pseudospiralis TaxID=6337 RepID=A0A0V0YD47_TRIPS|nr:hypothetical protein T4E_474 [Trichinella pseudospiralis]
MLMTMQWLIFVFFDPLQMPFGVWYPGKQELSNCGPAEYLFRGVASEHKTQDRLREVAVSTICVPLGRILQQRLQLVSLQLG